MEGKEYRFTKLVKGDGKFNVTGFENFVKKVKLAECGNPYALISIMSPQGSGKSTLPNHWFGTKFKEIDAREGRDKTTKGIWLAKRASINEPCTLVMDLEADTAFERQSALFALAVSDIVIINIWNHDIGLENAASKRLLTTVFQGMLKLFSPRKTTRKTTLMFVKCDKTDTPLKILQSTLMEGVDKIWNSIKPPNHKETRFNEFFKMKFVALPSYYDKKEEFKKQVASLRRRIIDSIAPGGLAGDRQVVASASAFSRSTKNIWKSIKENKDLNLPAHKVMVAKLCCEEIAKEKIHSFAANEKWRRLKENVKTRLTPNFGEIFNSIVDASLLDYDKEAAYFDEGARSERRNKLEAKLVQIGEPAYRLTLGHIESNTLGKFKESFDKALKGKEFSVAARECTKYALAEFNKECKGAIVERANCDIFLDVCGKLRNKIHAYTAVVCSSKLTKLTLQFQAKLRKALSEPVKKLLIRAEDVTWLKIRKLLSDKNESVASSFSAALSALDLDERTKARALADLKSYARGLVKSTAEEVAGTAEMHMASRFQALFCYVDSRSSKPRVWENKEEIQKTAEMAFSACLKMLSVLAAIRLKNYADNIKEILSIALMGPNSIESRALDVDTWQKVSKSNTMIAPPECKDLWKKFKDFAERCVANQVVRV